MTYNVFGGTLNLTQLNSACDRGSFIALLIISFTYFFLAHFFTSLSTFPVSEATSSNYSSMICVTQYLLQ